MVNLRDIAGNTEEEEGKITVYAKNIMVGWLVGDSKKVSEPAS